MKTFGDMSVRSHCGTVIHQKKHSCWIWQLNITLTGSPLTALEGFTVRYNKVWGEKKPWWTRWSFRKASIPSTQPCSYKLSPKTTLMPFDWNRD